MTPHDVHHPLRWTKKPHSFSTATGINISSPLSATARCRRCKRVSIFLYLPSVAAPVSSRKPGGHSVHRAWEKRFLFFPCHLTTVRAKKGAHHPISVSVRFDEVRNVVALLVLRSCCFFCIHFFPIIFSGTGGRQRDEISLPAWNGLKMKREDRQLCCNRWVDLVVVALHFRFTLLVFEAKTSFRCGVQVVDGIVPKPGSGQEISPRSTFVHQKRATESCEI